MALLDIVVYPNPILRTSTQIVTSFGPQLKKFVRDMFSTMVHFDGVGLAAPQVGVLEKIIVFDAEDTKMALINPEIISHAGRKVMEEGCLSIPGSVVDVARFEHVRVMAQDVLGHPIEMEVSGLVARVIQHEIDHLNGVLIIDKGPVK